MHISYQFKHWLCFLSNFLVLHTLGSNKWWLKYPSPWKTQNEFWLTAWSSLEVDIWRWKTDQWHSLSLALKWSLKRQVWVKIWKHWSNIYTAGGIVKWCNCYRNFWQTFRRLIILIIQSSNFTPITKSTPNINENKCPQKLIYKCSHCIIHSSQREEIIECLSPGEWAKCDTYIQWNIIPLQKKV